MSKAEWGPPQTEEQDRRGKVGAPTGPVVHPRLRLLHRDAVQLLGPSWKPKAHGHFLI